MCRTFKSFDVFNLFRVIDAKKSVLNFLLFIANISLKVQANSANKNLVK